MLETFPLPPLNDRPREVDNFAAGESELNEQQLTGRRSLSAKNRATTRNQHDQPRHAREQEQRHKPETA